ncbi:hypothetical protein HPP92_006843 [Vanilla planifolia]|uniref:Uncharacterized protein n=1 Tax=Vanilla planifolia TaxID=51239 RepID=A0A835RCZ1_VANPL|nr:hypothetical protein HPP92_006843 [Vanilla planifolia]
MAQTVRSSASQQTVFRRYASSRRVHLMSMWKAGGPSCSNMCRVPSIASRRGQNKAEDFGLP